MQSLQAKACRYPRYLGHKQEDYFLTLFVLCWQALWFFSVFHNCCEFSKTPISGVLLSANPRIFFKCIFQTNSSHQNCRGKEQQQSLKNDRENFQHSKHYMASGMFTNYLWFYLINFILTLWKDSVGDIKGLLYWE